MPIYKLSRIFQPISAISKTSQLQSKDVTSKSQRLLMELGFIKPAGVGHFHLLPLGVRILEKLERIVDGEMMAIGAQKVTFPTLINSRLWNLSGRLDDGHTTELFKVHDRHKTTYILSPTHEEAASDLLASLSHMSYKQFPLKLYQITTKFRDEMKPRFGLIRSREFLMKDLYTFDTSIEKAKETYYEVCNTYEVVFKKIGVDFLKVLGTSGNMGGNISHEYHYLTPIGEDRIVSCSGCGYMANIQLSGHERCFKCGNKTDITISTGIEVGHTFLLGDRYSVPLKAYYKNNKDELVPLQMGSYGLGLSRIIAAVVEVLSTEQEVRWPDLLAPFNVIIIPPKSGSKEEKGIKRDLVENLHLSLDKLGCLTDNILLDDRTDLTVGRRFIDARRVGYPYAVIIGSKILQNPPLYELIDIKANSQMLLTLDGLLDYFKANIDVEQKESINL